MTGETVTLESIRAAASLLRGIVERTATHRSPGLSELCGCELYVKFENHQRTASFKARGAAVKLESLSAAQRKKGVVAASAGNHAQGVAYHAQRMGIPATIFMPEGTPFTKVRRTENYGAEVRMAGEDLSGAEDAARTACSEQGLTFVHPYDDPKIIAGQGTVALEMLEDVPDLDILAVPIGGGGLISGIATAAKALKPGIGIVGVEAALYPAVSQTLRGEPSSAGGATIAEGIAVKRPGKITLEIIRNLVDDILLVDEPEIEEAVHLFLDIEKTVAEGAGAAPLAAVLAETDRFAGKTVGVVLSGGNIDARLLSGILMRSLVRAGQLVRLRVDMTDAPGVLGRVGQLIGEAGGNIVEVYHQRLFNNVPLKMAELDVIVETRDAEHVQHILAALRGAGMTATQISSTTGEEIG